MTAKSHLFKFKQFEISQKLSAMKIGTDGVLLGAWAPVEKAKKILDVGTGTGLIALMCAQRNRQAQISGVEIDPKAAGEAQYNFNRSPWKDRLKSIQIDFKVYQPDQKFDVIISNPPFFDETVLSTKTDRNIARHTQQLNLQELIKKSRQLLTKTGMINLILPVNKQSELEQILINNDLYLNRLCYVKGRPEAQVKRILVSIGQKKTKTMVTELIIETQRHVYTPQYIQLTKDFYLKMPLKP